MFHLSRNFQMLYLTNNIYRPIWRDVKTGNHGRIMPLLLPMAPARLTRLLVPSTDRRKRPRWWSFRSESWDCSRSTKPYA